MPCEHYKNALVEAASSGATPNGEMRAHLAECASCRDTFAEEQSLFSTIDSGLHDVANSEVPPSLLPRVRASLDEAPSRRFRWVQPLVFASAGVALAFVVFLLARSRHAPGENAAKQRPIVPAAIAPATSKNPEVISTADGYIAPAHGAHTFAARNSTVPHSVASGDLEVLVPPDEREGLAKLVATLNEHGDVVASLLAKVPEKAVKKDGLESLDPLQIPDIEIKPLDGTETSDGAGEKH